ncbi:MAG: hypothetical protein CFE26_08335 [Verrucomicrobiales bacterium VVV1]|nr:MAG: hypothetical protein CFE26_08335 [Verrucomicrobiales bacterium VVV1]
MKPRLHRFFKAAIPSLIVLPAMAQLAAAATLFPNVAGDVFITLAQSGPNNVQTGFGGPPPAGNHQVLVDAGVTLNPLATDVIEIQVSNASGAFYTINNNGTLVSNGAVGNHGIDTANLVGFTPSIIVNNTGSITGASAIRANNSLTLINSGVLSGIGLSDAAVYTRNGGTITNNVGGSITGLVNGIVSDSLTSNLIVNNSGTIRGINSSAILVSAGLGATINNSGLITSPTNAFSGGLGNDVLNLNAGSALAGSVLGGGGIDTINFNGGLTTPGGINNSIRGNVTAITTINKTGTGVAFIGLPGDPAYTVDADTIAITGGGLYLKGNVTGNLALQTTINANGAALGGTGLWDANVNVLSGGFSAGEIPINLDANPVNAVGAVTITGDVVHTPGSFIRFDVVPDAPIINGFNSDLITQTGVLNSYNVAGANLRVSSTNNNQVIRDGTYTVVASDTAILGYPALGTLGVQYNANVTDTGFVGTQVGNVGVSDTNNVLSQYFMTTALADANTNLVLNVQHNFAALPGSDLGTVQASLAALDPSNYLGFTTVVTNSNYRLHRMVQDHLAVVRDGGETITETSAPTQDSKGGMIPGQSVSRSTGGKGNAWGAVSYDSQDYDAAGNLADFNGETWSFTAGFDWRLAPEFVLGIVLDGSRGSFDGQGSSTDVDSYRGAVYGTWGASMGLYSDFLVGYGDHSFESTRTLGGVLGGLASGNQDANSLQALWTIGYTMGNQQVKHGPFIGVEYQNVEADGFTETGALPLSISGYEQDSLRGLAGYRVNTNLGTFRPYASVAYAHEFEDGQNRRSASFGGTPFSVVGADQSSAILITAGTGIGLTDSLTLDIGYRGEIAIDDGLTSHGGSIGLNYSF